MNKFIERFKDNKNDDGFTLTELIIYSMLSLLTSLIILTAFTMLFNIFEQVRATSFSSNDSQILTQTINKTIQDSNEAFVTPLENGIQGVVYSVNAGNGNWMCSSILFMQDDENVYSAYHMPYTNDPIVLPIEVMTDEELLDSEWGIIISDIEPNDGKFFETSGSFVTGNRLSYSMNLIKDEMIFPVTSGDSLRAVGNDSIDCVGGSNDA